MPPVNLAALALEAFLGAPNHALLVIDERMIIRWASPSTKHYGVAPIGTSVLDLIDPDDLDRVMAAVLLPESQANSPSDSPLADTTLTFRCITPAGKIPVETSARWVTDSNGDDWFIVLLSNVTPRAAHDHALRALAMGADEPTALAAIIDAARAITAIDGAQLCWLAGDGELRTSGDLGTDSEVAMSLLGLSERILTWNEPTPAELGGYGWGATVPLVRGDAAFGHLVVWGQGPQPILTLTASVLKPLSDLTTLALERTQHVAELEYQATTDSLTGLLNRRSFFDALDRPVKSTCAMYLDADQFKAVNDAYGHSAGDGLLSAMAKRLTVICGEAALLGRLGGDEFAVLSEMRSLGESRELAERILEALVAPFLIGERWITVQVSVGLAFAEDIALGTDLLERADQALLRAKSRGKACVVVSES